MMKPIFTSSLITFAAALTLMSCTSRRFNASTPNKTMQSTAANTTSTKNHGGPFNFGVTFSPVNEKIAKTFWASWKDPTTYATRRIKGLKDLKTEGVSESLLIGEFKDTSVKQEVLELVRTWFATAGKWAQLSCQHIDMEAAYQNKFSPSEGVLINRGEPSCFSRAKGGGLMPSQAGWDPASRWFIAADRKPAPVFMNTDGGPDTGVAVLLGDATSVGFVTRISPDIEWNGNQGYAIEQASHYVIGNYLIPSYGWSVSKAFATPVMEFDGDPKSPTYLKPKAWYDLGMFVLHGLPEKGNILVSRVGENLAGAFADSNSRKTTGFLAHKFPPDRLNTFISPAEAKDKDYVSDDMMERMPVGSMHFIANAAWAQMGRGLTRYVYVKDVSRDELIRLYTATDKASGSVWVNALDRMDFSGNAPSAAEVTKALVGGECDIMDRDTGLASGFFMETEIILGMEEGRKMLLSDRAAVSKCEKQDFRD